MLALKQSDPHQIDKTIAMQRTVKRPELLYMLADVLFDVLVVASVFADHEAAVSN